MPNLLHIGAIIFEDNLDPMVNLPEDFDMGNVDMFTGTVVAAIDDMKTWLQADTIVLTRRKIDSLVINGVVEVGEDPQHGIKNIPSI